MTISSLTQDLTRTTLALLFIGILIAATFWILHPFISAGVWATMIVVSTWPLMLRVQSLLWGRRSLAVAFMSLLLLMLLVVPFFVSIVMIVERSDEIVGWVRSLATLSLPALPDWVANLPVVGRASWPDAGARWPPSARRSFRRG